MEDSDFPGDTSKVFNLIFSEKWHSKGDIISDMVCDLEILSEPTKKYCSWYWRILEYLTFKRRFYARYEYECKVKVL